MTEKNEFEPDEVALLSSKAKWLEEELKILGQSIGSRSQVLQSYVAFLKSSEEVRCLRSDLLQQGGLCLLPASLGIEAAVGSPVPSIPTQVLTYWPFILQGAIQRLKE